MIGSPCSNLPSVLRPAQLRCDFATAVEDHLEECLIGGWHTQTIHDTAQLQLIGLYIVRVELAAKCSLHAAPYSQITCHALNFREMLRLALHCRLL
mmetsp:Transcript_42351/g.117170  ORF Transcript_42351/g.117170 Transcript_42351/m.117170 type:complete len:96 (+) Transcript_42351:818-1105(+)